MPYFILKTLHILGIAVWLGGMTTLLLFYTWLARRDDRAGLRGMIDLGMQFGQRVIGPAVGIALMAAILMIVLYDVGMPFWVIYGIVAMALSMALGGGMIRKKTMALSAALDANADYRTELSGIMRIALINLLILVSAVAVMVIKP